MAALYRGPKKGYELTDLDRLVLAASLWGEGGKDLDEVEAGAVAWSMMMRFQLMNMKWAQEGWAFSTFIRAFSQPVNPRWADPSGAFCQKHPDSCTPSRINRRKLLQSYLDNYPVDVGWEKIQYSAPLPAKYAQMFQDGQLPNPFSEPVYDFAACSLTQKQTSSGSRPSPGINIGGNCFLTYNDLNKSEKSYVIEGEVTAGAEAHKTGIGYLIFGAIAVAALWIWHKISS